MAVTVSPRLIIEAAQKRGWTVTMFDEGQCLYRLDLPTGEYYYIRSVSSIRSHSVNSFIGERKDLFYKIAKNLGVPLPDTMLYTDEAEATKFLERHRRVVVKPVDQGHGDGITINVTSAQQLAEAIGFAGRYGPKTLIQQQIEGEDYRILMIGSKLAAAAVRKPAYVVGDGQSTIATLIAQENASPRRTNGYHTELTSINMVAAERYLGAAMTEVPAQGKEVRVIGTANIGKGGVALDVTDTVDPKLVAIAHDITEHFGIGFCGVDFLVTAEGAPYVIEINTRPSLGLHEFPFEGRSRNTPDAYLDWLSARQPGQTDMRLSA